MVTKQKSKISQRSYPKEVKEEALKAEELSDEPTSMIEDEVLNQPISEPFNEVMANLVEEPSFHELSSNESNVPEANVDEAPMKSSCVAPEHGGVEAAKEKDERKILDEPMVAKAIELFSPKKVRVKRKA